MGHETASMLTRIREQTAAVEERVRGTHSTDPSTRLLNSPTSWSSAYYASSWAAQSVNRL
jgi:hypothetical protein